MTIDAVLPGPLVGVLVAVAVLLWPRRPSPQAGPQLPTGRVRDDHRLPSETFGASDDLGGGGAGLTGARHPRARSRRPPAGLLARVGSRGGMRVSVDDVAATMVLLALAYRAGLPPSSVLERVADRAPHRCGSQLRQVAAAVLWGASETEAWASVDERWAPAAAAVSLAHMAGLPPAPLLLRAADDLRLAQAEEAEAAAARVGVRLVLPLGLVLLPAFCLTTVVPLVLALAGQVLAGG